MLRSLSTLLASALLIASVPACGSGPSPAVEPMAAGQPGLAATGARTALATQPGASSGGPGCPAAPPVQGEACSRADREADLRCRYDEVARCPFAFCADVAGRHEWQVSEACPIECPAELPAAGSSCPEVHGFACHYPVGPCGTRARCGEAGWELEEVMLCGGM
jgi:hypothetical protein